MESLRQSSLNCWLHCKAEYYIKYILEVKIDDADPNMAFGSYFHQQIENYHKGKKYDSVLIAPYAELYPVDTTIDVELPFEVVLRHPETNEPLPLPFTGIIDQVTSEELRDIKTSRVSWSQNKADGELQATGYLYYWWQSFNKLQPFTYVVYRKDWQATSRFKRIQTVTTTRSVEDFTAFWLLCNKVINDIKAEDIWNCTCMSQEHAWLTAPNVFAERIR